MKPQKVKSLSITLLRAVFGIYLVLTAVVTLGHMVTEYTLTKESVQRELTLIEQTFTPALRTALWELNRAQLQSITTGIRNLPVVVDLDLIEPTGAMSEFSSPGLSESFSHSFSIYQGADSDKVRLADVRYYSDRGVIIDRVKYGFLIILLNEVVKLIVLWFLFKVAFRRLLSTPLERFSAEVAAIDLNHIRHSRIHLGMQERNELQILEESFNKMLGQIEDDNTAMIQLERSNQLYLEEQVSLRTLELQVANEKALVAKRMAEQSREAAIKANNAKSAFLANMSHELRTPMHGILSFASFGQSRIESADREKLGHYFTRIKQSGDRLLELLNDLLDLSKLEAGKMVMEFHPVNMRTLLEQHIQELQAKADEQQIHIVVEASAFEPIAHFDAQRIGQVITNLLSNAIKFSPAGGAIRCSFAPDNIANRAGTQKVAAVRFCMEDEGVGIPADELELVFDQFIQSSKTATGAGGTGLGLAICHEIIEGHNGRIWAESQDGGHGARFQFVLPLEHEGSASG